MNTLFEKLEEAGYWRGVDAAVAACLCRLVGEKDPLVRLAVAAVSRFAGSGHVCADLRGLSGTQVQDDDGQKLEGLNWPDLLSWAGAITASKLVAKDEDDRAAPLVLWGDRLYLRRYYEYERSIAEKIARFAKREDSLPPGFRLGSVLLRLFGAEKNRRVETPQAGRQLALEFTQGALDPRAEAHPAHGQYRAVATAALRPLTIISGGPGTGKTHTVLRILCGLVERATADGGAPPRIRLAAPTGKAAARLSESILRAKQGLEGVSPDVLEAVSEHASTIHRLLEPRGKGGTAFRYSADEPLSLDVLVVDEASMVDASLMAKLLCAVPDTARLVLVGDEDQLASVEAGSVFADICHASRLQAPSRAFARRLREHAQVQSAAVGDAAAAHDEKMSMADSYVRLTHSFRFSGKGGIGRLAACVRAGDADGVLAALRSKDEEIEWVDATGKYGSVSAFVTQRVEPHFQRVLAASDPAERLKLLGRLQILCAHRRGAGGAEGFNHRFETWFAKDEARAHGGFFDARPLLVVRNAPGIGLYNGDVGVVCHGSGEQQAAVAFWAEGERVRMISPARLPEHESVYAMTVHKSQGSEYQEVLLVLPPRPSPVMTRELLYTAVTRAKKKIVVIGTREVVRHAVRTPTQRRSGLAQMLAGENFSKN